MVTRGKGLMTYPLHVSPVAALRAEVRALTPEAARRLGLAPRYLAVLEMKTKGIPPGTLTAIRRSLEPTRFTQISIWEAPAELDFSEAMADGRAVGGARSPRLLNSHQRPGPFPPGSFAVLGVPVVGDPRGRCPRGRGSPWSVSPWSGIPVVRACRQTPRSTARRSRRVPR